MLVIQPGRAIVMSYDVGSDLPNDPIITSSRPGDLRACGIPLRMSNCTSYLVQTYLEEPPTLSSLLWIAVGVGTLCLVLQAALTLLFAKLLPAGPWTSQPAFAA